MFLVLFLCVLGLISLLYLDRLIVLFQNIKQLVERDSLFELAYFESRIGRFLRKVASFFAIIILKPTSPFLIHILLNNLDEDFRSRVFGTGLGSLIHPSDHISQEEAEMLILDAARRLAERDELVNVSDQERSHPEKLLKRVAMHAATEVSSSVALLQGNDGSSALSLGSILAVTVSNVRRNAERIFKRVGSSSPRGHSTRFGATSLISKESDTPGVQSFAPSLFGLPYEIQRVLVARKLATRVTKDN